MSAGGQTSYERLREKPMILGGHLPVSNAEGLNYPRFFDCFLTTGRPGFSRFAARSAPIGVL